MNTARTPRLLAAAFLLALASCQAPAPAPAPATATRTADTTVAATTDPLASWNDGGAKQAILDFVKRTTTEGSSDFVPVSERIAVFDNDGTLWPEYPAPFQLLFAFDELKRRAPNEPKLAADPMVKAALAGDLARLAAGPHHDGLVRIMALTHAGMTTDEFRANVEAWLASAKHPRFGQAYDALTYQPMQEVLRHLRANGFKTYIVSGGGADFMRVWSERVYGIPPEQVVGSSGSTTFELRDDGPVLVKTFDNLFMDDKGGKPVGIWHNIGRRPIACFGNSDGDQAMLEYTTIHNPRPSFGLIVHHTDSVREYAYDVNAAVSGKLNDAMKEATQRGWTVVDMAKDWKTVYTTDAAAPDKAASITAIDILLQPDAAMLKECKADNERLLKAYPKGFALDATHTPHITMLQCFVPTTDLEKLYAAEEKIIAAAEVSTMKLDASKRYYIPAGGGLGVAGIVAKPTPELLKLQADIIAAAKPFMVKTATIGAFTAPHDDPAIDAAMIQYVSVFEEKAAGAHFNPHVSTGNAPTTYLDTMVAEPFTPFTFSPAGAAIYQLGPFGTAAKKLKELGAKP